MLDSTCSVLVRLLLAEQGRTDASSRAGQGKGGQGRAIKCQDKEEGWHGRKTARQGRATLEQEKGRAGAGAALGQNRGSSRSKATL